MKKHRHRPRPPQRKKPRPQLQRPDIFMPEPPYDPELLARPREEVNAEIKERLAKIISTATELQARIPLDPTDYERFGNQAHEIVEDADWCWWVTQVWTTAAPELHQSSNDDTSRTNPQS